jgi:hypothetical protein
MNLSLDPTEADILREVLSIYLSDLRAEIGKTEAYDAKQELKRREVVLGRVLTRLGQPVS